MRDTSLGSRRGKGVIEHADSEYVIFIDRGLSLQNRPTAIFTEFDNTNNEQSDTSDDKH